MMLGGFLALLSAALFGLNNAVTRLGVVRGTVIQGMAITVPLGALLFFVLCAAWGSAGEIARFPWMSHLWFALAGISHFVFGRYCNYRAIAAIGSNLASPIQQWEVLVTLALALVFLGERLTGIAVIAIALLVLGPYIAGRIDQARNGPQAAARSPASPAFEPRFKEGYFYAFLSIFGYGASPIFVRAGLQSADLGASLAAGFISYFAASIVVVVWVVAARRTEHVATMPRESRSWFLLAGVLVFLSQVARYMALALLPASIVAALLRLQSLARFYFSWLIARDYEVFDRNVLIGTLISMIGAVLITLPPETVSQWLPLPEALRQLLAARWL